MNLPGGVVDFRRGGRHETAYGREAASGTRAGKASLATCPLGVGSPDRPCLPGDRTRDRVRGSRYLVSLRAPRPTPDGRHASFHVASGPHAAPPCLRPGAPGSGPGQRCLLPSAGGATQHRRGRRGRHAVRRDGRRGARLSGDAPHRSAGEGRSHVHGGLPRRTGRPSSRASTPPATASSTTWRATG